MRACVGMYACACAREYVYAIRCVHAHVWLCGCVRDTFDAIQAPRGLVDLTVNLGPDVDSRGSGVEMCCMDGGNCVTTHGIFTTFNENLGAAFV